MTASRWSSSLVDTITEWSLRGHPDRDPDRMAHRRSAIGIGLRVGVVSAVLTIGVIGLVIAYVFWQLTPGQVHEQPGPGDVAISLDTIDLSIAVIGVGGFSILFAGIAAWVIARRAVRPIAEAARIQRTFVADASHELRTPLTVLHARVQRLQRLTPPEDARRGLVDDLRGDSQILIDIVNDLLEAAAGTTGPGGTADLVEALGTLERDMTVLATDQRISLRVPTADPALVGAVVGIPATQLHRCLVALTDNAVGHSHPDGEVRVTVEVGPTAVTVRVADDGPGITGIPPARVFDRFAHGTPAREARVGSTGSRSGYGIGLALVRDIAVRAGGDVTVEHTDHDGSVFALRLPLAAPRPTATAPEEHP